MTVPVIVTVPPTGMSPVQTAPVVPIDRVPELAVSLPPSLVWLVVLAVGEVDADPEVRGLPGVGDRRGTRSPSRRAAVVGASGVDAIGSWETVTVAVHRGPGLAAGQLLFADRRR